MAKKSNEKKQTKYIQRPFPRATLEDALKVAYAIKEKNGGNPWSPDLIAEAVGTTRKSPLFFYMAAAARDMGLTVGSRDSDKIELAPLGREIVYAPNAAIEAAKKKESFLRIELFQKVLNHYKGSNLPEMKYLGNTLENEFGLTPETHEEFSRIFRENCKYLGIESGFATTPDESVSIDGKPKESHATPSTIILAEPLTKSKLIAFVIMPFVEKDSSHPKGFFDEVLRSLITPAARDAGFTVITANRQGSDVIQSTIINDLINADLVIADLTEHNPNVLFELGLRMANDKPVALIKATGTGRIFDVDNLLRVYEYNSNLWATTIEKDRPAITQHIKGTWENKDTDKTYMKILQGVSKGN
jgi:hypothetical protein